MNIVRCPYAPKGGSKTQSVQNLNNYSCDISETVPDRMSVTVNHLYEVAYGLSISTDFDDLG